MITVAVPTHNPNAGRLERTIEGLRRQTFPTSAWELILVDNASTDRTAIESLDLAWHPRSRVVLEPALGLTAARICAIEAAQGDYIVLVDDDNVLASDYLEHVARWFAEHPECGAIGGRSRPEFEQPPPDWVRQFDGLLALRDLGAAAVAADWRGSAAREYPGCAPIGAGMSLRRTAAAAYAAAVRSDAGRRAFDRTGQSLTSGGDNDLVMTVLGAGYSVAYVPQLDLTHLIPPVRCTRNYLGRLNRAIARSWVRVLAQHGVNPWSPVRPGTVRLRQVRSWFRSRAWAGAPQWIAWQGACGHFEGCADLWPDIDR